MGLLPACIILKLHYNFSNSIMLINFDKSNLRNLFYKSPIIGIFFSRFTLANRRFPTIYEYKYFFLELETLLFVSFQF